MLFTDKTCREFVEAAASGDPVPGGGSVASMTGALGAALTSMVASLTKGKKKAADMIEVIEEKLEELKSVQHELIELVQTDIEHFRRMSELYATKSDDPQEQERIEAEKQEALYEASVGPLEILKACGRAIELSEFFVSKANKFIISDAGASAAILKGAMQAASLNIYINTSLMNDRELAEKIIGETEECLEHYTNMADYVFDYTMKKLTKTEKK